MRRERKRAGATGVSCAGIIGARYTRSFDEDGLSNPCRPRGGLSPRLHRLRPPRRAPAAPLAEVDVAPSPGRDLGRGDRAGRLVLPAHETRELAAAPRR